MSNRNILGTAAAVLAANSAYLAAVATPSLFYYTNVGFHVVLGVATLILAVRWLRQRASAGMRMPASWIAAAVLLGAGAVLGGALAATGTTTRFRWLLLSHIAASTAGAVMALAIAAAALAARRPWTRMRPVHVFAVLAIAALAAWFAVVVARQAIEERTIARIVNPLAPPLSMDGEGAGRQSPFFPSSSNTNVGHTIPSNFFMTSRTCASCHKDVYD